MPDTLVLFNGMQCTDLPPGQVGRYRHLRPGSWVSARLLLYVFSSFPRLWTSVTRSAKADADSESFQYNWRGWVAALEGMQKDRTSWAALAKYLVTRPSGVSYKDVSDIARAIIELAMRDAESERNACRSAPLRIPTHSHRGSSSSSGSSGGSTDEQHFMTRVRAAVGYEPRAIKVERCVYRALVWRDAAFVLRIAQRAPANCVVHSVVKDSRF